MKGSYIEAERACIAAEEAYFAALGQPPRTEAATSTREVCPRCGSRTCEERLQRWLEEPDPFVEG